MKLMIASDIHGSYEYCKKLIEQYKIEKADRLVLLGDILYHGPRNDLPSEYSPKSVIDILNPLKNDILCVRGNCDTEVDQMVLDFSVLSEYAFLCVDNLTIYIAHGHRVDSEFLSRLNQNDILICGHTHIPACEKKEDHMYLNPGSVSIPKNGSQHSYMIYENGTFFWKNLNGEVYNTFSPQK